MYCQGPRTLQLKFNILFNVHFPSLIFFKSFLRKKWRGEGELLLKNDTLDGMGVGAQNDLGASKFCPKNDLKVT